jgi:hypothetical protein
MSFFYSIRVSGLRVLRFGTFVCLGGMLLVGCNGGRFEAPTLDEDLARVTLQSALESWQRGDSQDALQELSPPVTAADPDWMTGLKLLKYEIVDEGQEVDGRLVSHVKLTLQDERGGQAEKSVSYLVNTSPGLTVLRDIRQ